MEKLKEKETPVCCETCLYMATHEKCEGCLFTDGRTLSKGNNFEFNNWKKGLWIARMWEHELKGKRNIVIGGQGEAELNTKQTPQEASENLHRIAGSCGYMCGKLCKRQDTHTITISTHEGAFRIWWRAGELESIEATAGSDWSWSRQDIQDMLKKLIAAGSYTPED